MVKLIAVALPARFCALVTCALACGLPLARPAQANSLEQWVATAVRFVQWPADRTANRWTLCQPAGEKLLQMDSLFVRAHGFQVVSVVSPKETGPCDVFVTSAIKGSELAPWVASLHSRPVVTIGMGYDFCAAGGMLCVARDRVGTPAFVVNRAALIHSGLRVNGHLPMHPAHVIAASVASVARAP